MQIVTTHKNTDFDALASVFAATMIYPDAVPVLPGAVNPNVKAFLSIHKDLFAPYSAGEIDPDKVRRLIVVDTGSWDRLDALAVLRDRTDLEIVNWDHHDGGDISADWVCREPMGATITLMIRQLKAARKLLTPMQATLFLAGIYEDTGSLSFPSAKAEDAYAAGFLLERKADLSILNTFLRPAYGVKQKDVLFRMLETAKRTAVNGYKIGFSKIDLSGHVDQLAVVVRMYLDIVNVDAAFGIFSNTARGKCIVIGRSRTEGLDVGAIMRSLGGGGHPGAGSAQLEAVNPDAVESMISGLIEGNQQASVLVGDLMSFPVVAVAPDTPMAQVAVLLREKGCTGVPVVERHKPVGIISRRDFRKIRKESQLKAPVKAFMSRKVRTIAPDKSPMAAARLMVKHDIGRLPVVKDGKMIGIITRSDSMRYFYDLLPD